MPARLSTVMGSTVDCWPSSLGIVASPVALTRSSGLKIRLVVLRLSGRTRRVCSPTMYLAGGRVRGVARMRVREQAASQRSSAIALVGLSQVIAKQQVVVRVDATTKAVLNG